MIGSMDQVITLFDSVLTPDGFGGNSQQLVSKGQFFAKVNHLTGEEREHAGRNAQKQSVSFTMHNISSSNGVNTSVIEWSGFRYDIVDVEFSGNQNLYITYKCVRGELNA